MVPGGRAGTSTAVVHGEDVYLVDLGRGSPVNMHAAGIAGHEQVGGGLFSRVRGIFFTHLHSDHTVEWPSVYATGPMNVVGRSTPEKIQVFGPGDRQTLTRVFPAGRPEPELHSPDAPTAGITGMTDGVRRAFATDFNDRARDSNFTDPAALFDVHEIDLSEVWDITPDGVPPRLDRPIPIWRDGDVTVTATLVDHRPTAPAFAFRFDTPDGSVVISGDTAVSPNLIDLAHGCDYLIHEVIDSQYVEELTSRMPGDVAEPLREHLLTSHTAVEQVGSQVAEAAGAKNLILNHLVPANNPRKRWEAAQTGYSGNLIVGEDLMVFGLGPPTPFA